MAHPDSVLLVSIAARLGLRSTHRLRVRCVDY
jgi:hypothetical protein